MSYESPTIRPPSEWRSGLLRITRGCQWNRCRFCGIYPHLGQHDFSIRPVQEIFEDMRELSVRRSDIEALFLGDADPLSIPKPDMLSILEHARSLLSPRRITSYARFSTLRRLGPDTLAEYHAAGLTRLHCGLESGDAITLARMEKGQSPKMVREVAGWLKEIGLELSVYVLLGLGGQDRWRAHVEETAYLLGDIRPACIRIRRLFVFPGSTPASPSCPLAEEIAKGLFIEQTAEGTVRELELLLELLPKIHSYFTCDHRNNFVNVAGYLDSDKDAMLSDIKKFLDLPADVRQQHYAAVGSGI